MTVWDFACQFADKSYVSQLQNQLQHDDLVRLHDEALKTCNGIENKRWLFVYSPTSASTLFECSPAITRRMIALSKIGTVAKHGGMLFVVSVTNWGTKKAMMTPSVIAAV